MKNVSYAVKLLLFLLPAVVVTGLSLRSLLANAPRSIDAPAAAVDDATRAPWPRRALPPAAVTGAPLRDRRSSLERTVPVEQPRRVSGRDRVLHGSAAPPPVSTALDADAATAGQPLPGPAPAVSAPTTPLPVPAAPPVPNPAQAAPPGAGNGDGAAMADEVAEADERDAADDDDAGADELDDDDADEDDADDD